MTRRTLPPKNEADPESWRVPFREYAKTEQKRILTFFKEPRNYSDTEQFFGGWDRHTHQIIDALIDDGIIEKHEDTPINLYGKPMTFSCTYYIIKTR